MSSTFYLFVLSAFFLNFILICSSFSISSYQSSNPNAKQPKLEAHKIVCNSNTSMSHASPVDIACLNGGVIRIVRAISGIQSIHVCAQMGFVPMTPLSDTCDEILKTSQIVQHKCNGLSRCTINFVNSFPRNCADDTYSYTNITYQCVRAPVNPFDIFGYQNPSSYFYPSQSSYPSYSAPQSSNYLSQSSYPSQSSYSSYSAPPQSQPSYSAPSQPSYAAPSPPPSQPSYYPNYPSLF